MSERSDFIEACFTLDLQEWYREWISKKGDRLQFFYKGIIGYTHLFWNPSSRCRASGQILTKENIDIYVGYWTPNCWFPIHKDLLKEHKRSEAYECQKIDCSCNDCAHFKREVGSSGHCEVLNKKVIAYSNTCCPENSECFLHRRDQEEMKQ